MSDLIAALSTPAVPSAIAAPRKALPSAGTR